MKNDEVVSVLNDLVEVSKDGEAGFRTCADDLKDPALKRTFNERAEGCASAAAELQQLVAAQGGKPEQDGSVSGKLHRGWVDLKSAITGKDDAAILSECERGEDVALKSYRKALEKDLPPQIRAVVEKQYQGVQRNHDQVKALRDAARAQS